jgi:hypothetical protein
MPWSGENERGDDLLVGASRQHRALRVNVDRQVGRAAEQRKYVAEPTERCFLVENDAAV